MKASDIANAVARNAFPYRRHLLVPKVYWGWGLDYEADLIAVSGNGYATEIEIKISRGDLVRDHLKAKHQHPDPRISRLYYAMPMPLAESALELLPEEFGVIGVAKLNRYDYGVCKILRKARKRPQAQKLSDQDIRRLMRLAAVKFWGLQLDTLNRLWD